MWCGWMIYSLLAAYDRLMRLRNKMSRSKFTAAFMLLCLEALGTDVVRLND